MALSRRSFLGAMALAVTVGPAMVRRPKPKPPAPEKSRLDEYKRLYQEKVKRMHLNSVACIEAELWECPR